MWKSGAHRSDARYRRRATDGAQRTDAQRTDAQRTDAQRTDAPYLALSGDDRERRARSDVPYLYLRPALQEAGDGGGAGVDVKFLVDVSQMTADGAFADTEFAGNFLGLQSARDALKDFRFARREAVEFLPGAALLLKSFHHEARDLAGHRRTARVGFGDGLKQFGRRNRFDEVANRASFQGFKDSGAIVLNRENQNRQFRPAGHDVGNEFKALGFWQFQVQQQHVRLLDRQMFEGDFGSAVRSNAAESLRAADERSEMFTKWSVVLDGNDLDVIGTSGHGLLFMVW